MGLFDTITQGLGGFGAKKVPQPNNERLYSVRPRSSIVPIGVGGSGNRGSRANIKILSTNPSRTKTRANTALSSSALNKLVTANNNSGFTDFLLTSCSVNYSEKVQITQTFGDSDVVYYFGQAPVVFNLGGILIDDVDNGWFAQFVDVYQNLIRGTQSAKNYEMVQIGLPHLILIGSVMTFAHQQEALRDTDISFSMSIHVKQVIPIPVSLPGAVASAAAGFINFKSASSFTSLSDIMQKKMDPSTISSTVAGLIQNPATTTSEITSFFQGIDFNGVASKIDTQAFNSIQQQLSNVGGSVSAQLQGISPQSLGITQQLQDQAANFGANFGDIGGKAGDLVKTAANGGSVSISEFSGEFDLLQSQGGQLAASFVAGGGNADFTDLVGTMENAGSQASDLFNSNLGGLQNTISDAFGDGLSAMGIVPSSTVPGIQSPSGSGGPTVFSGPVSTSSQLSNVSSLPGFGESTTNLLGFKSSLFSPIYGVLTSITKIVQNSTGSITGILSGFTSPVNSILRDIQGIAAQAIGVAKLIEASTNKITQQFLNTENLYNQTRVALSNAAGVISNIPETIAQSVQRLFVSGNLAGTSAILSGGGSNVGGKTSLLLSGGYNASDSGALLTNRSFIISNSPPALVATAPPPVPSAILPSRAPH